MFSSKLRSTSLSLVVIYLLWAGPDPAMAGFDPDTICTLIANGTKINDPRSCGAWIECVDGEPVTGACESGHFYDREKFECVPAAESTCLTTSPCSAYVNPDGIFAADPYSCTSYYYCNGTTVVRGECSNNRVFNPESQLCSATYVCVLPMDPNSYCNIVPDGVFIGMPDQCTGYQMCWNGEVVNRSCPHDFYFDPQRGVCDYSSYVRCAASTTPDVDSSVRCPAAGVFIADGRTCNGYFYCAASEVSETGYTLLAGSCPPGWFFDAADGGVCVPRTRIECAYDRCAGMGIDHIELANESDDECRGFSVCQNGVSIGGGSCPDGMYFDEVAQWCTESVVQFVACAGAAGQTTVTDAVTGATTAATVEGEDGSHTPPTDAATATASPNDGGGDEMPTTNAIDATDGDAGEATVAAGDVQAATKTTQNDVQTTETPTPPTTTSSTIATPTIVPNSN